MIRYLRDTTRSPESKRPQVDLIQQLNRWHAEEREKDSQLEAAMYSMEVAFRMQTEAPEAFDISREPRGNPQPVWRFGFRPWVSSRKAAGGARCARSAALFREWPTLGQS